MAKLYFFDNDSAIKGTIIKYKIRELPDYIISDKLVDDVKKSIIQGLSAGLLIVDGYRGWWIKIKE